MGSFARNIRPQDGARRASLTTCGSSAAQSQPTAAPSDRSPAACKEFEQLTQGLLDAAIEFLELADGEPDTEPNGDEFEKSDGGSSWAAPSRRPR
jgi:hypothetical protein